MLWWNIVGLANHDSVQISSLFWQKKVQFVIERIIWEFLFHGYWYLAIYNIINWMYIKLALWEKNRIPLLCSCKIWTFFSFHSHQPKLKNKLTLYIQILFQKLSLSKIWTYHPLSVGSAGERIKHSTILGILDLQRVSFNRGSNHELMLVKTSSHLSGVGWHLYVCTKRKNLLVIIQRPHR